MTSTRTTAVLAIACLALILAVMFVKRMDTGASGNVGSSTEVSASPVRPATVQTTKQKGTIDPTASATARSAAVAELLSTDAGRWKKALSGNLKKLGIADIWDVLMTPGIDQQVEAKSLREELILSCITQLHELEVKGKIEGRSPSLLTDSCAALHTKADAMTLGKQAVQLQGDEALHTAESRVLGFDPAKLDAGKLKAEQELAAKAVSQTNDPWLAAAGVRNLWALHSQDILPDWSEIASMSRFQNSRLEQVIATDISCSLIEGCGPNSPWTLGFCATMPGVICPPDSSFDSIVALNLSQAELNLRQKILANLAQRYRH